MLRPSLILLRWKIKAGYRLQAMEENKEHSFLRRFGDDSFTWGVIGVIVGAAIASPASFKIAFICGGIAVAMGGLRSRIYKEKSITKQILPNIGILLCVGLAWFGLWKAIPKPKEPATKEDMLTKEDLREVREAFNQGKKGNLSQDVSPSMPADRSAKPATKADLMKMLQQYQSDNKFSNTTIAMLSDMARVAATNLRQLAASWQIQERNERMRIWDPVEGTGATLEMRKTAPIRWAAKQKELTDKFTPEARKLLVDANECRLVILNRLLPEERNLPRDQAAEKLFDKTGNPSHESLLAASTYIEELRKRLP